MRIFNNVTRWHQLIFTHSNTTLKIESLHFSKSMRNKCIAHFILIHWRKQERKITIQHVFLFFLKLNLKMGRGRLPPLPLNSHILPQVLPDVSRCVDYRVACLIKLEKTVTVLVMIFNNLFKVIGES